MTTESVWMTLPARQRLEAELAELESRPSSSDSTATARAHQLRALLRNAEVGSKPDDGLVEPGMRVTVRFERDASTAEFLLGSRELSGLDDSVDTEVYSSTSPLGSAISGHYVGDVVSFAAPAGMQEITILSAVPFS